MRAITVSDNEMQSILDELNAIDDKAGLAPISQEEAFNLVYFTVRTSCPCCERELSRDVDRRRYLSKYITCFDCDYCNAGCYVGVDIEEDKHCKLICNYRHIGKYFVSCFGKYSAIKDNNNYLNSPAIAIIPETLSLKTLTEDKIKLYITFS